MRDVPPAPPPNTMRGGFVVSVWVCYALAAAIYGYVLWVSL